MHFVSSRLKDCRFEKKLSRDRLMVQLSRQNLQVHTGTIRNWEEGRSIPDAQEIKHLMTFFNKPFEYFFDQNCK